METNRPSPVALPKHVNNISNKDFNDWHVEYYVGKSKYGDSLWLCRCKCGEYVSVIRTNIVKGYSKRCTKCGHQTYGYDIVNTIPRPIFRNILHHAKKRNIVMELTNKDLSELFNNQRGRCAITNIVITLPKNSKEYLSTQCTASLDRINNELGYIKGNVQWVHKKNKYYEGAIIYE